MSTQAGRGMPAPAIETLAPGHPGVEAGPPSVRRLTDVGGQVMEVVNRGDIEQRLAAGTFFWLDLDGLGVEEVGWLRDVFKFHPLAVEDSEHFGERPKLEEYDGFSLIVLYGSASSADGATAGSGPGGLDASAIEAVSEVHCFVSASYFVTVRRGACPALRDLVQRFRARKTPVQSPARIVYRIADALVDSFFPVLSELDDRIDALQEAVIERPDNQQLAELLQYRGALISLRRVIAPQRDLFASLASGVAELPGFGEEDERYFRDVYDHLIRLSDQIDGYRDLLSGTTDAYLSVVSNQLNVVMKQLTIISTVFLPLAYLTGFFGQNFSWLVVHLGGAPTFFIVGVGTEVIAVALLMWLFRRRGWLGPGSRA